jgi:hypothetical protein
MGRSVLVIIGGSNHHASFVVVIQLSCCCVGIARPAKIKKRCFVFSRPRLRRVCQLSTNAYIQLMSALSPVNSNDIRWSDGPNQNGRNSQADNNTSG